MEPFSRQPFGGLWMGLQQQDLSPMARQDQCRDTPNRTRADHGHIEGGGKSAHGSSSSYMFQRGHPASLMPHGRDGSYDCSLLARCPVRALAKYSSHLRMVSCWSRCTAGLSSARGASKWVS